jgi:hypothetical protein
LGCHQIAPGGGSTRYECRFSVYNRSLCPNFQGNLALSCCFYWVVGFFTRLSPVSGDNLRNAWKSAVNDEAALPFEYVAEVTTTKVDKAAIKAALSAGVAVSGAKLSNGTRLVIK